VNEPSAGVIVWAKVRSTARPLSKYARAWRLSAEPAIKAPRALVLFAVAACLTTYAGSAHAHNAGVSSSRIVVGGRTVEVEINALGRDFEQAAGVRIVEKATGETNPAALALMAPAIRRYVDEHVAVLAAGQRCAVVAGTAKAADTHVLLTTSFRCPAEGELRYRSTLFQDVDPSARHVAVMVSDGAEREFVLDRNSQEIGLSLTGTSLLDVIARFIAAGIEHIFLGYDHIAFLLAVILWGRTLWPLVKVVTAFTIAHSITLSLAALQVFTIPSAIVEPAIAASIMFVAAENFFSRNVDRRWPVTFVFGLVHGFGFASALAEIGLPSHALVPALAAFNIGVEIGQVAIVALVFPLLLLADRLMAAGAVGKSRQPSLVHSCSAVIFALGLYWLIERTVWA
jgi:hydrogenase/urease accessory protein HupE